MTFLNPVILFGLPAVALPIIIHLFTRTKVRTVRFSTLAFLKELQQQKIRSVKLRQILLLIIRTLIILMLLVSFSRPTLKGNFPIGVGSRVKTSAAIILDNSVSMARIVEGKSLFDRAQERAQTVLDILTPGDEAFLILPTEKESGGHGYHDLNQLRRLIENTGVSYGMTKLDLALARAANVLAQSLNFNREIYLISDLQATGFTVTGDSVPVINDDRCQVIVLDPGVSKSRNLAIKKVEMKNQILEPGKVIEIDAEIKNEGDGIESNKLVQLFINDKRTAQNTISLEPGQTTTTTFRFITETTELHTGYVQLEEDDLPYDDLRYFSFYIPDQFNILLVGNHVFDTANIRLALEPVPLKNNYFNIEQLKIAELTSRQLRDTDVLILVNVPGVDEATTMKINEYVTKGGGLVVLLGDAVDLRLYNNVLNKKLGLPEFGETMGLRDNPASAFALGKVDFSHPIFRGLFQKEEHHFNSPQVYLGVKVKPNPGSQSIIEYSDGHPFLIETKAGHGSVLVYTTSLQQEWSNFAYKSIFAPLMHRSVSYLASLYSEKPISVLVDETIRYGQSEPLLQEIEIVRPNQARVKVNPKTLNDRYLIEYNETDIPGVYCIQSGDNVLTRGMVNLDPRESEIEPIEPGFLENKYKAQRVPAGDTIANFVERQRYGRELWKYFAIFALGLLVLEMLIYRERGEVTGEISKE